MGLLLSRAGRAGARAHVRHVSVMPPAQAGEQVARVYAQLERDFGMLAPPIALHSAAPGPLAAAWTMLRETMLSPGLLGRAEKESVAVAVSDANACPYCTEVHSILLYGLTGGSPGTDLEQLTGWVRDSAAGRPVTGPPPVTAGQVPELIGTVVTFQYLNRMVDVFLADSPIPAGVPPQLRGFIRRVAGRFLRPVVRRTTLPGASLELLPAAAPPADQSWTAGNRIVGEAFARAAAAIEAAGRRSVPDPVRELVTTMLDDRLGRRAGRPDGPGAGWVNDAVATLPHGDRAAGRLALLAAFSSYQVGDSVIEEFRRYRSDDQSLVEAVSWASLAAARRHGASLWRARQRSKHEEAR